MKHNASILALLLLPIALGGCSTYGYKTALGEHSYAPVDYHKVKLLFGAPEQPYEVIGVVSVQGGSLATAGDMYQKLIKSAATLGADAVIVTGEGNNQAILPGVSTTYDTGSAYGSATATTYGKSTNVTGSGSYNGTSVTSSTPTYLVNMPTNKGLAIKFTR